MIQSTSGTRRLLVVIAGVVIAPLITTAQITTRILPATHTGPPLAHATRTHTLTEQTELTDDITVITRVYVTVTATPTAAATPPLLQTLVQSRLLLLLLRQTALTALHAHTLALPARGTVPRRVPAAAGGRRRGGGHRGGVARDTVVQVALLGGGGPGRCSAATEDDRVPVEVHELEHDGPQLVLGEGLVEGLEQLVQIATGTQVTAAEGDLFARVKVQIHLVVVNGHLEAVVFLRCLSTGSRSAPGRVSALLLGLSVVVVWTTAVPVASLDLHCGVSGDEGLDRQVVTSRWWWG